MIHTYMFRIVIGVSGFNLVPTAVRSLNITAIAIYDTKGSLVNGLIFDKNSNKVSSLSSDIDLLFRNSGILSPPDEGVSSIIAGYPDPIIIASYPILTSKKEGPRMGEVVIATILDGPMIKSLSLDLLRDVSISPIGADNASYTTQTSDLSVIDQNRHKDSTILKDFTGRPAYLLTIHEPET